MTTLAQLLQEREALEQKINQVRQAERAEALAQIHKLIQLHGLTVNDVFGNSKSARQGSNKKVAVKYLNKETGETWTGRGKPPRWIQGQDREKFLIQS
ncbi:histone [Lampropedia cohaerens]|uniref:Histone n=1 Tax=Lampropedia cohaerens TaxID=1610491 RepID=A0A0U1Q3H3_9BURK|nr:H-NS histone family protein [Lampropedia cohaerens]KKW69287.1 histone [Lampropedia cohaerens]